MPGENTNNTTVNAILTKYTALVKSYIQNVITNINKKILYNASTNLFPSASITMNASGDYELPVDIELPAGTYTLSFVCNTANVSITLEHCSAITSTGTGSRESHTITINSDTSASKVTFGAAATLSNIQLEYGSTATAYKEFYFTNKQITDLLNDEGATF